MAEYYPLLARAVASLPNSTPETRNAIYERARKALLGQLRSIDPPIPAEHIERENKALDEAMARLESELAAQAKPEPATTPSAPESVRAPETPPPAPAPAADHIEMAPRTGEPRQGDAPPPVVTPERKLPPFAARPLGAARPSLFSKPGVTPPATPASQPGNADPASSDGAPAPVAAPPVLPGFRKPASPSLRSLQTPPSLRSSTARPEDGAATPDLPRLTLPRGDLPEWDKLSPPRSGAQASPFEGLARAAQMQPPADAAVVTEDGDVGSVPEDATGETKVSELGQGILRKFGRPRSPIPGAKTGEARVPRPDAAMDDAAESDELASDSFARSRDGMRPMAPQAAAARTGRLRHVIVASVVAIVVGAVAVTAYVLRDRPEDVAKPRAAVVADPADNSGKIVERIGAGTSPSPVTAPARPAAPQTGQTAPAASAAAPAPAAPTAGASSNPPLPVAQRAALLIQAPTATDPQAIATYVGSVVWRLDTVPAAQGQPNTVAVRADIDVPDAKMKATMIFQRNTDETLPASHLIDMRFMPQPGSLVPAVKQIDSPQMRREDTPAGDPLAGLARPVRDNFFFVALAKGDSYTTRNLDLIKTRAWFDIPMLLSDNKIAKITFEKGPSGDRAFTDAFASWRQ